MFKRNALAVSVITAASMIIILALVLLFQGPDVLFATHLGEGAFYRVVPFVAMTVPPSLIALYGLAVFIIGALRFWRETQGPISALIDPAALWRATKDAFGLAYMKGGGAGCNYPAENFSRVADVVSPSGLSSAFCSTSPRPASPRSTIIFSVGRRPIRILARRWCSAPSAESVY